MPKEKREISKEDIMPLDVYTKNRKELRKNIVDIEKDGEEQLKDELAAYNPLVPNGKELTATLMFEIDNPVTRAAFLGKVGGIEEKVFMKVEGEKIQAVPEEDVDRTSAEGKASSVP